MRRYVAALAAGRTAVAVPAAILASESGVWQHPSSSPHHSPPRLRPVWPRWAGLASRGRGLWMLQQS